jgi:hypothetical protein
MLLLGEQLTAEFEETADFGGQFLTFLEAFREHAHFSNEFNVRGCHSNWSEKLLQIVWQLGSTSVALTCGVHGDEDTSILVHLDGSTEKGELRLILLDSILDDLDVLRDGG